MCQQLKAEQLLEQDTSIKEKTIMGPTVLTDGSASGWGTAAGSSSHCNAQDGLSRGCTINHSCRDVDDFLPRKQSRAHNGSTRLFVMSY